MVETNVEVGLELLEIGVVDLVGGFEGGSKLVGGVTGDFWVEIFGTIGFGKVKVGVEMFGTVGFDKVKVGEVTDEFWVEILCKIGFVKVNEGGGVLCNLVLLE